MSVGRAGVVALALGACEAPDPGAPDAAPGRLLATTAADDYSAGGLSAVDDLGRDVVDLTSVHGDAVLVAVHDAVVVINRLGMDAVRRYDTPEGAPTWERSVGRGANPHAVAATPAGWLVTRYEEPEAWLLDPETGEQRGVVDLAAEADGDGVPEMSDAVADGDLALVALQRLDRDHGWGADPSGRVVVVDPAAGTVVRVVSVGPNPSLVAHPEGGAVAACEDGLWRVHADGAVFGPSRPAALTGTVGALAVADDGSVYAVTRPCPTCASHRLVCLDAWDGEVVGQTDPIGAYLSDVAVLDDTVWLAARRGWEDPSVAGGFVPVPRGTCGPLPAPEGWLRGAYAPYALTVRASAGW